jgi:hypothetical protein
VVVRVRGAVGRFGRSIGGVGEEWRRENEWARSRLSGAVVCATERERKERGGGVRPRKCHAARDGVVGSSPDRRAAPRPCPSRPRPGCDVRGRRVAVQTAAHWRRPGETRWQRERGGTGGARACVGRSEKKAGWPSPDEQ